jgi:hypothetical protein
MRTTLTVDDDVATALKRLERESGRSFKETVNDVLRRGLNPQAAHVTDSGLPLLDLRPRPGVNLGDAMGLLREMEAEYDARKLGSQ